MIDGWDHLCNTPKIISADKIFWKRKAWRNLDRIVRILVNIPKEFTCIVCGKGYSLNFTTRSSLADHIKNHARTTIDYWLNNIICKSPEELEAILYFDEQRRSKENGVVDY